MKLATALPLLFVSYPYFPQTLFCADCLCGQWQVKHGGWLVEGHGRVWMERGRGDPVTVTRWLEDGQ